MIPPSRTMNRVIPSSHLPKRDSASFFCQVFHHTPPPASSDSFAIDCRIYLHILILRVKNEYLRFRSLCARVSALHSPAVEPAARAPDFCKLHVHHAHLAQFAGMSEKSGKYTDSNSLYIISRATFRVTDSCYRKRPGWPN